MFAKSRKSQKKLDELHLQWQIQHFLKLNLYTIIFQKVYFQLSYISTEIYLVSMEIWRSKASIPLVQKHKNIYHSPKILILQIKIHSFLTLAHKLSLWTHQINLHNYFKNNLTYCSMSVKICYPTYEFMGLFMGCCYWSVTLLLFELNSNYTKILCMTRKKRKKYHDQRLSDKHSEV